MDHLYGAFEAWKFIVIALKLSGGRVTKSAQSYRLTSDMQWTTCIPLFEAWKFIVIAIKGMFPFCAPLKKPFLGYMVPIKGTLPC